MENLSTIAENNNVVREAHLRQTVREPSPLLGGPEQNLKAKSTLQAGRGSSTLRSETMGRKAFAVQDKVKFTF